MALTLESFGPTYDPSARSAHVSDRFYEQLLVDSAAWRGDGSGEPAPAEVRAECEDFLVREARLLDDLRLNEWLELFAGDCMYWIPHDPDGGDPRKDICLAFDDRRRLEDRIVWLLTGKAYSQVPRSRTTRMLSNFEVRQTSDPDQFRVRSSFVVHEVRVHEQRAIPGWYGYRLRRAGDGWNIVIKQVNLLEADRGLENMTVVL